MKRPAQLLCQLCCSILLIFPLSINAAKTSKEYFQIKVYHYEDASQADRIESFLEHAFVPAVHRAGIENVGVFKPIENPEASDNRIINNFHIKSSSLKVALFDRNTSFERSPG